jgi:PilZ domain
MDVKRFHRQQRGYIDDSVEARENAGPILIWAENSNRSKVFYGNGKVPFIRFTSISRTKGCPRVSQSHERRDSPRCSVVENQSRLEFAVPEGRRRVEAKMVNISRGGALLVTGNPPACDAPVWLRLESPVKTDWAEATTVRHGRNEEVGVRFPQGCPDDLLLAGTIGIDLVSMVCDPARLASNFD